MRLFAKFFIITLLMLAISSESILAAEKWSGNDVVVGDKIKELSGTEAKEPLINFSGDLGLFVFAIGGFSAGVIVGYQGRKLFVEKKGE